MTLADNDLLNIVAETMLVDLLNQKKAEVFENVVFDGKKRYYIEDLTDRDYLLENTTPYQINIMGHSIEEHAWTSMLAAVVRFLLTVYPEKGREVLLFKCSWSKAAVFGTEERINFKEVASNLYINVNHTALHSCWLIQDLLDYFGVNKSEVHFLIHRPCSAEPKRVKEYIEKRFKSNFIEYIKIRHGKSQEYGEKVVRLIDKYLNPMLRKISKSYDNFFLFDDNSILYNYVKKVRERINYTNLEEKNKKILHKYLDYLVEYYKE